MAIYMNGGPRYTDIAPVAPDLVLITDYLAGALRGAERDAVEKRLEEDDDFFEYCTPVIKAWTTPVRLAPSLGVTLPTRATHRREMTRRRMALFGRVAAVFALLVGVPLLYVARQRAEVARAGAERGWVTTDSTYVLAGEFAAMLLPVDRAPDQPLVHAAAPSATPSGSAAPIDSTAIKQSFEYRFGLAVAILAATPARHGRTHLQCSRNCDTLYVTFRKPKETTR